LRDAEPRIEDAGASLFVVGNGLPQQAKWFAEDTGLREEQLFTDPARATYKAAGLKRGFLRTMGPAVWAKGRRARQGGFKQSGVKGDPWQEGGVFVVTPDGSVPYSYISETAGDHPEPADVVAAVEAATPSG
jgi:AhpC/TSA antioxidant enzyme